MTGGPWRAKGLVPPRPPPQWRVAELMIAAAAAFTAGYLTAYLMWLWECLR